ncbi:DEAD/DEAH box helicase [Aquimonas sp.]|jgi:hypothetical protein|uniref:DEAD/DEAH box helicase n=1 Tax=Aquimonas sp. TaxID=1872588 RepID=UPI0037BE359B
MAKPTAQAGAQIAANMEARFAALAPAEKALVELLALTDSPVSRVPLQKALGICGLDPFWVSPNPGEVTRRVGQLTAFVNFRSADHLAPLHPIKLRVMAARSLLESGRAKKVAQALMGPQRRALAEVESQYHSDLRERLRIAAALGGASGEGFGLGAFYTSDDSALQTVLRPLALLAIELGAEICSGMSATFAGPVLSSVMLAELAHPASAKQGSYASAMQQYADRPELRMQLLPVMVEHALLRGELPRLLELGVDFTIVAPALRACEQLLQGAAPTDALPGFEASLATMRKANGPRYRPTGLLGLMHLACLSVATAPRDLKRREQLARGVIELHPVDGGNAQLAWQQFTQAHQEGRVLNGFRLPTDPRPLEVWWVGVLHRWSGLAPNKTLQAALHTARAQATAFGWRWLQAQIDCQLDAPDVQVQPDLLGWIEAAPPWQSALNALGQALATQPLKNSDDAEPSNYSQLTVQVAVHQGEQSALQLNLVEHRPNAKGGWSSGREVRSIQGVANLQERLPPGDDPDRRLVSAMMADAARRDFYGEFAAQSRTVNALIGHPRVFDMKDQPLQVRELEPRLQTRRLPDGRIELKLDPALTSGAEPLLIRQGGELLRFKPSPTQAKIAGIIGSGLALPPEALSQFMQMLPGLGRTLNLDGSLEALGLQDVQAQAALVAQLEPAGEGLAVRIGLRPLGADGPFVLPAVGADVVLGQSNGAACRARRDFTAERRALAALEEAVPLLAGLPAGESLRVEAPDEALDVLAQLQEHAELGLEWKAGKSMRVARIGGKDPLQIKVAAKRDWFAASGGLTLDDGSVVALAEVLRGLPSGQGRYLRLDGDRVLALDAELRRRLQVLRAFADERGQVQVPMAAAYALEGALDESSQLDAAFRKQLKRMDAARDLQPELPRLLQAELRDYQIDGYKFLLRLAAWGAGACLADDMGLGKTVQALAVLLARAGEGPALVVAPTSLVGNWRGEATRFAPSLNIRVYGDGDREAALSELAAGDVVVVSYGLLVSNIDAFAELEFASLVLDEAQAFKNAATQRAQAVRRLKAGFRMACTGTPLENHLGELWSLFRVLNPGLLGSEESFRTRFLLPLERDPRGPQREILRRLIAPFLLRRTKSEVLSELPARTEIVQSIEPSPGEAQLLAALRKQALERLSAEAMPGESKRFQILAELTRLRRAACHPNLVAPELKLTSAKLEQLVELVTELIDNRHRALVFSQFTDYLAIVRARFEAEGIAYRYLDGSTPSNKREAEVAAFQRGEGDVFLLSLKAGGVGLNLTAADYVIHLDPWWNPAVEQQATDRAHRIGQTRPVTVYKLVLAGSIEQQILDMHGAKRELIDQVIGDQASATAVGVDELLGLLSGA